MKLSASYLAPTAAHLREAGYLVTENTQVKHRGDDVIFQRTCYQCRSLPAVDIVLEAVTYPDGGERYFLEIMRMGPLRSLSFPSDSWKFHPTMIEFKYYSEPETGMGLSFILDLPPSLAP